MNSKSPLIFIVVIFIPVAVFGLWQYGLHLKFSATDMSCGGDWAYMVKCPLGSYCRSLGQNPLAGGICEPWISIVFEIFSSSKERGQSPLPTVKPTVPRIPTETLPQTPISFPTVTVQSASKVISTSYTSLDGSFIVAEEWLGDYNMISIRDKKGIVLMDDLVAKNEQELGMNKKFRCMCGVSFKGWISSSLFAIRIANGIGEEYEFIVEATTGKTDESTFKRVK